MACASVYKVTIVRQASVILIRTWLLQFILSSKNDAFRSQVIPIFLTKILQYSSLFSSLARYNSLTDPNLQSYFSSDRIRSHLKHAGLVD